MAFLFSCNSWHKPLKGHTCERIADTISNALERLMGAEWKDKLFCAVTDGASNVTAASRYCCIITCVKILIHILCLSDGCVVPTADVACSMACSYSWNTFARLFRLWQPQWQHAIIWPSSPNYLENFGQLRDQFLLVPQLAGIRTLYVLRRYWTNSTQSYPSMSLESWLRNANPQWSLTLWL